MKCARGAAPANLLNTGHVSFSLRRPAMSGFPRKSLRISLRASLGSTSISFIEALSLSNFDPYQYVVPTLFFPLFSLTLASLRPNGALAARHTPLGIGSSGRPDLNVSGVEVAGVGWRI